MTDAHTPTMKSEPADTPGITRGSPKAWKWIVAAILVVAGVIYLPLLQSHADQDSCSFGPVTNERYRELLAEAKTKQATVWPSLLWRNSESQKLLQARFDDLSGGSTSAYERLAAMHAVLRALGADYRRTGRGGGDAYQEALSGAGIVPFRYHLDVNRLGYFRPIWRQAQVIGELAIKHAEGPFLRKLPPGEIYFTVSFPELLETYRYVPRSGLGEACPIVPSADLAERLSSSDKK